MRKRNFLKYQDRESYDVEGNLLKIGDTVVINNNYGRTPYIGIIKHYTESGAMAIEYRWHNIKRGEKLMAYRFPDTIIKLRDGNNTKEYKFESQS